MPETLAVARQFARNPDWESITAITRSENLLRQRTAASTTRILREIRHRLDELSPAELDHLVGADPADQRLLLFITACRLNFFVDEVGQFIGRNSKLMLNLQTIVETLSTKFTFKDAAEFTAYYPFLPYQFELLQECLIALSQHSFFTGRQRSIGERSMLGILQDVVKAVSGDTLGRLASFDAMFEGIRNALRADLQTSIQSAERNLGGVGSLPVRVLKVLFLVKYIKPFKPSAPPPANTTTAGRNPGSRPKATARPTPPPPFSTPWAAPPTLPIGSSARPWTPPASSPARFFRCHGPPPSIGVDSPTRPSRWSPPTAP